MSYEASTVRIGYLIAVCSLSLRVKSKWKLTKCWNAQLHRSCCLTTRTFCNKEKTSITHGSSVSYIFRAEVSTPDRAAPDPVVAVVVSEVCAVYSVSPSGFWHTLQNDVRVSAPTQRGVGVLCVPWDFIWDKTIDYIFDIWSLVEVKDVFTLTLSVFKLSIVYQ